MRLSRIGLGALCLLALPAARGVAVGGLQRELVGGALVCRGSGDPVELIFSPDGGVFVDGRRGTVEWSGATAVLKTVAPPDEITVARRGRGTLVAQLSDPGHPGPYTCTR